MEKKHILDQLKELLNNLFNNFYINRCDEDLKIEI